MTDNHNGETCEGCLYLSRSSWVCNAITDGVQSVKPWRTECVCEPSEFIPSLQYRQVLALEKLAAFVHGIGNVLSLIKDRLK